jgi:hypothetical protein
MSLGQAATDGTAALNGRSIVPHFQWETFLPNSRPRALVF